MKEVELTEQQVASITARANKVQLGEIFSGDLFDALQNESYVLLIEN